ncbi:MAG: stage II sporulation protein R [Clostridia bacterium]|nr:stage II sporulation protein R [Clostridia bacterium]
MLKKFPVFFTKLSNIFSCKNLFILSFILLNLIILSKTYNAQSNIQNYFRVHVTANSNSISDQLVKYTLADKLNNYISSLIQNCSSKKDCKKVIEENVEEILAISNNILKDKGKNYTVYAKIGNIYYEEKQNDNMTMSAGIYDSIQIVLGEGKGKNWWSLIYPNAFNSYVEYNKKADDTNHISSSDLISSEKITYHFGLYELIAKLFD